MIPFLLFLQSFLNSRLSTKAVMSMCLVASHSTKVQVQFLPQFVWRAVKKICACLEGGGGGAKMGENKWVVGTHGAAPIIHTHTHRPTALHTPTHPSTSTHVYNVVTDTHLCLRMIEIQVGETTWDLRGQIRWKCTVTVMSIVLIVSKLKRSRSNKWEGPSSRRPSSELAAGFE